jgi:hypothetical protein
VARPWAEADEGWRAWALSEVSVRRGRIEKEDESDPVLAAAVATTKAQWSEAERMVPLIALRQDGDGWRGQAWNSSEQAVEVRYSPTQSGLLIRIL